jgi:hypothetical protein
MLVLATKHDNELNVVHAPGAGPAATIGDTDGAARRCSYAAAVCVAIAPPVLSPLSSAITPGYDV